MELGWFWFVAGLALLVALYAVPFVMIFNGGLGG